jgi:hypothetical protein
MNLRVFRTADESLAIEISSPTLSSSLKWFVPLLPANSPGVQNLNPAEIVRVSYESAAFVVPFFLIRTVRVEVGREEVVGQLSSDNSIDILNNIYDRMAYDLLP